MSNTFMRDDNFVPITRLGLSTSKEITYAAATTGAVGAANLFTVTGTCLVRVLGVCSVNLASGGASTIEVGISGDTANLIAQITSTDIDANDIWIDTSAEAAQILLLDNASTILDDKTIIQTIGTATITSGTMTYYCLWTPISTDGSVTPA